MSSLFAVCPAPFQKPKKKGELHASMDRLERYLLIPELLD